ncbi:Uncharacterised protein [Mycobacteroides abscessus subsp. massiliense]|nr:Uncharacterised protein [Mycobacteroides abscessus subsp. massiliense]
MSHSLNTRSHHSRQMVMVMNIIIARMMTITLNSQVNYSDYSLKMQKSVSSQIQLMQWMGSLKMSKFATFATAIKLIQNMGKV